MIALGLATLLALHLLTPASSSTQPASAATAPQLAGTSTTSSSTNRLASSTSFAERQAQLHALLR